MLYLKMFVGAALVAAAPFLAEAKGIKVSFSDTVKPDKELLAFIETLKSTDATDGKLDYAAIDALFAPKVQVFSRSLDPFQPWFKGEPLTGNFLAGAADVMVEQGPPPEGTEQPDYRPDALKMIIAQVNKGEPFGKIKEVPGSICAPAEYSVDRKAARKFAKLFKLDAYSLRFYAEPVTIRLAPSDDADIMAEVPPYTLMMFDYDPKAPEPWAQFASSSGIRGFMKDDRDPLGLSQQHVCFVRVKGKYRISALFGFGL